MKLRELITASIDTETTGPNPSIDRIITLGIQVSYPGGVRKKHSWTINPGMPIPPASTAIHGITDEMVKDAPPFASVAPQILETLCGIKVHIGFCIYGFDAQILMEEFGRNGFGGEYPEDSVLIIDAGTIFKKKESRTLVAAVLKYCNKSHEGAHGAIEDACATDDVIDGQLAAYADLAQMDVEQLAEFSKQDGMVDFAGKLKMTEAGVVYNFGKSKGMLVEDDRGFAEWMLGKDFTTDTKKHIRRILEEYDNPPNLIRPKSEDDVPF